MVRILVSCPGLDREKEGCPGPVQAPSRPGRPGLDKSLKRLVYKPGHRPGPLSRPGQISQASEVSLDKSVQAWTGVFH